MKKISILLMSVLLSMSAIACSSGSSTSSETVSSTASETSIEESSEASFSGTASKGGLETDTYVYYTTAFPTQYDYVLTNRGADGVVNQNFQGSLLYYDYYGIPTGDLAESWSHNEDYTEWTFNIRQGVYWSTADGEKYAEITAQDWVTSVQHAADFNSSLVSLLEPWIVNLTGYEKGEITFDEVGVSAPDTYTLVYSLKAPCTFFESLVKYIIFTPVNQSFLESKGTGCKLGEPDQSTCNFGNGDADSILYSGAYLMTSKDNYQISMVANPNYWNSESVFCHTIKYMYYDGTDLQTVFSEFDNGNYTYIQLNATNASVISLAQEYYGDEMYSTIPTETSYWIDFNIDRRSYANVNDDSIGVSNNTTEEGRANTKNAMLNVNFRKAIRAAFSAKDYMLVSMLEEFAPNSLRNVITPNDFVATSDGTQYGDLVAKYLTEIGSSYAGKDLTDGHDAYHSIEEAVTYVNAAVEELGDSVTYPVMVEVVTCETNAQFLGQATVFKQCMQDLNEALGWDFIDVQFILEPTSTDYYYAAYYVESGDQGNFDIYLGDGWGPDYYDPQTYLNCFESSNGDLLMSFGINPDDIKDDSDYEALEASGWNEFEEAYLAALEITTDPDARYEAMAKAEAIWLDLCISAPISCGGNLLYVSRVIPTSWTTHTSGKFQFVQVQDHAVTSSERATLKAAWDKAYAQAQAEYYSVEH